MIYSTLILIILDNVHLYKPFTSSPLTFFMYLPYRLEYRHGQIEYSCFSFLT